MGQLGEGVAHGGGTIGLCPARDDGGGEGLAGFSVWQLADLFEGGGDVLRLELIHQAVDLQDAALADARDAEQIRRCRDQRARARCGVFRDGLWGFRFLLGAFWRARRGQHRRLSHRRIRSARNLLALVQAPAEIGEPGDNKQRQEVEEERSHMVAGWLACALSGPVPG